MYLFHHRQNVSIGESRFDGVAAFELAYLADELSVCVECKRVAFGKRRLGVCAFYFFTDEFELRFRKIENFA
jgi:hypothetical protein